MKRTISAMTSRVGQFIILGVLLAAANAFGAIMAASLFLSNAGPHALPVYYFVFALVFVPCSVLFSGIVDRWPRRVTMMRLLTIYMAGMLIFAACLGHGIVWYYAMHVFASIFVSMNYSTYFILISDYFSVTEAKRISGKITIALGAGTVLGAALVSLLTRIAEAHWIFLVLPLLIGATQLHLMRFTRREHPLDEEETFEDSIIESLRMIPPLARRYPIVPLMSALLFVNVVIGCILEFQTYSIYSEYFRTENDLLRFYGKVTAFIDVIGILIALCITGPLLPKLGVPKMSLVGPAVNFLTFLTLAASSGLPAGILAHFNYHVLENSLHAPVFSLMYNAVPRRFVGRVRVINEGVIYTLALAFGGVLLLAVQHVLSLSAIALVFAAITFLYLLGQWTVGRQYVRGLVDLLRSGGVDLDDVNEGFKPPDDYIQDMVTMVRSGDAGSVTLGLELASRGDIEISVDDFERALPLVPRALARTALARTTREPWLRALAESPRPPVRALALEALIKGGFGVELSVLRTMLEDEDETTRAVAAAGLLVSVPGLTAAARTKLCHGLASIEGTDPALAALYVLSAFDCVALPDALVALGRNEFATVRAEALSLAAKGGAAGDVLLLNWGRSAFTDADASVRAGAAALLVRVVADGDLAEVWRAAYADPKPEVRRAASLVMGRRGGVGLAVLSGQLRDADEDAIGAVMDGIGEAGAAAADRIFFRFFSESLFPALERNLGVAKILPLTWRALHLAIADSNARAVRTVLHGLDVLGYKRVVGLVRTSMRVGDPRTRANAIETLSTLSHRRYVMPLMPILEVSNDVAVRRLERHAAHAMLAELTAEKDPSIRAAAIMAWYEETGALPETAGSDSSAFVAETVAALTAGTGKREEPPMNRLLFLKTVPLFSEMTLTQLIAVDGAMTRETWLPDERIVTEGQPGDKMYIVVTGEVSVRKQVAKDQERELARLTVGQLFGEMALFDSEARSASVIAVTETEVLALDGKRFNSLIHQLPEISVQICKVLVRNLRVANR